MRYYSLNVVNSDTDSTPFATYTSFPNGVNDPGALQVELDIPTDTFANPAGATSVTIWGVSLQTISQAKDFNGKYVTVSGGMQAGLPLANPSQAGVLASGVIRQAFGNWIGTNQYITFTFYPDAGTQATPKNIVLSWKKGTKFSDSITQTLATAFPNIQASVAISDSLVLSEDETGYWQTLTQFAQYVKQMSRSLLGGTYPGVDILIQNNQFRVFDSSTKPNPIPLAFQDFIGQPTWIGPSQVQFNCVMRANLTVGSFVTFPNMQVTQTATAALDPSNSNQSAFQGTFMIQFVRHVGSFRQPDAASWITTFNAVAQDPVTTSQDSP